MDLEDDSMEIDDSVHSARIIVREATGVSIIGGPPPAPGPDIVILDDDDEELPPKRSKNVEIIDLIPKAASSKCINYACQDGRELITAPRLCLSFYRVRNLGGGKKEVCKKCYDMAFAEYDMLVNELKKDNLLTSLDLPVRDDTVEIDDSDEEGGEEESLSEENLNFIAENLENVLLNTFEKFDIMGHTQREVDGLMDRSKKVVEGVDSIQKSIKEMRTSLDGIQINLYNQFRTETTETGYLSIIDDQTVGGGMSVRQGLSLFTVNSMVYTFNLQN